MNGNVDGEQRNIEVQNKHGKLSQQWDVVYFEDWPGEPQKGELNEEFGLYVERPFFIVSQLPRNRYLSLNGRGMVIRTSDD